jgi:hypothetical protein
MFANDNNNENNNNSSINQSAIKLKQKEKINNTKQIKHKKENLSRNNNYPIYQFDTNIKTYCEDPLKFSTKTKNMITSYKTKSQAKNKTKGYQTSRNKYDTKNMYINISKSNISKNHQSIDSDMNNNNRIKKNMNQIQNKHNNLKNNIINALLGSQNNNQKKKMTKYKDMVQNIDKKNDINKENDKSSNVSIISIVDSNELKEIRNTSNNNIIDININNNINEQVFKENNKGINNIEKNDSQNKRVISSSNIDKESNNKISSTSCTKTMSINSYGSKPKNLYPNTNKMNNNKKQISMSKIPNSMPENKIINNKINKKMNKINEDLENKNKLKEFIDNYLDDYFSSNNYNNLNNNFIDSKNKSKNKTRNEPLTVRNYIQERKKDKDDNNKIRKSIFNFEKRISKKLSEKNLNIFDKFKNKSSPKDGKKQKSSAIKINKSGNMQNSDHCCPLSARESNFKYQINSEMIELLSNKIQKIKQSIKETSDKGANSISSIFKKKKIPPSNKKILPLGIKKGEDFIEKKSQNSKTRNKKNKNGLVGTTSSNSNLGINGNLVNTIINSIYQTNLLSPNKKNLEYEKLMKTFHKFKRPTNSFNGNNILNNIGGNSKGKNINNNNVNNNNMGKKDNKSKKKHGRYNTIYSNVNNYENNFNIEVNIKNNLKVQPKKQINNNNINNNNNKNMNDNLNSLNINFNNYTNNYNYNYNINSGTNNYNNGNNNQLNNNINNINNININSNNYSNSIINKGKSSSQKIIIGKIAGKADSNLKGIPINGFDKLITKKYNSRNFNIPMSVTERAKQANIYATSVATNNTNSNRYRNSHGRHKTINRIYQKKY